ncbi:hypothetical protein JW921_08395, partial [Candidatus Fermentibacterales bacterium]|nr:hypothetical protein [Candidatus Fermentibacterales bacterium]
GVLGLHVFDYATGDWLGSYPSGGQPPTNLEGGYGDTYVYKQIGLEVRGDVPFGAVEFGRKGFEDEEPLTVYYEDSFEIDYSDLTEAISKTWYGYDIATGLDGRVFVAPRSTDEYLVYAWADDGTPILEIEREMGRVRRSAEEMETEEMLLRMKASAMGIESQAAMSPDPYRPMIRGLEVDNSGNLWVLRGGVTDPFFDVYDRSGELAFHVALDHSPPDGASWRFHVGEPGILAWAEDPAEGYQKVYLLELRTGEVPARSDL